MAALICNISVAMTPHNYEQTDSYILFLVKISKYLLYNTCNSILKYIAHAILKSLLKYCLRITLMLHGDDTIAILLQILGIQPCVLMCEVALSHW